MTRSAAMMCGRGCSVLTEMPDGFAEAVRRWSAHNAKFRSGDQIDTRHGVVSVPDAGGRVADQRRSGCGNTCRRRCGRRRCGRAGWRTMRSMRARCMRISMRCLGTEEFVAELEKFVGEIAAAGRMNSLAQTLMKYTAPGVPDMYQGGELWDLFAGGSGQSAAGGLWAQGALLKEMKAMNAAAGYGARRRGIAEALGGASGAAAAQGASGVVWTRRRSTRRCRWKGRSGSG